MARTQVRSPCGGPSSAGAFSLILRCQIVLNARFDRYIPLVRSSQSSRIRSNADIYDFVLDEEDMKRLDDLDLGADGAISWNPVNVE